MRNGAIISGLLHAGVAAAIYIGVPDFAEPLPVGEPIPVEVVSVEDIARAKRPEPVETTPEPEPEPAEAEQEPPPAPQPPEPEAAPVQQAEAPAPPAPEPQPAPPEPAPQPAATPPPPAPKPRAKPTPPPEPEPETAEEPPPEPESEPEPAEAPPPPEKPRVELADKTEPEPTPRRTNLVASILKNLAEQPAAEPARGRPPAEAERPADERVSMSERAALVTLIRGQVERCWLVPPGVKDAEKLVVELRVQLNPDGSLQRAEIVDVARLTNDAFYRAVAESALRAVKKCEPFQDLPVKRYEVWKDLELTFNPENYGT